MMSAHQASRDWPDPGTIPLPPGAAELNREGLRTGGLLRYRIDLLSLAVAFFGIGLQFAAYYFAAPWYMAIFVLIAMRWVHLVEHNHAHLPIFNSRWMNEGLGWLMFLNCLSPLEGYRVHHVQTHHVHTQGPKDWTSPYAYANCRYPDKPVGYLYYLLTFAPIAYLRLTLRALENPGSAMARRFWASVAFLTVTSAALCYHDPRSFFLFYVLSWVACCIGVPVNNWDHHLECDITSPYTAANTDTRALCTWLGFNIGYHTAHTWFPGLHWSKLKALHEQYLAPHVPEANYRPWTSEAQRLVSLGQQRAA